MNQATNWPARFAEMMDLVEFTEEDRQLIKASAPLVMGQAEKLTDALYDRLLRYPQARKFFVKANGEPDPVRLESNKQTMISWLRATAAAPLNEGFTRYLVAIAQMHINTPLHRPGLSPVAPRYIIGVMSYYQTVLADLLHQHLPETSEVLRTSQAWNKWLMVGLEMLLAGYLMYDQED